MEAVKISMKTLIRLHQSFDLVQ